MGKDGLGKRTWRRAEGFVRRAGTTEEVDALVRQSRKTFPPIEPCVLLAAESGLRIGEIVRCHRSDVDGNKLRVRLGKGKILRWTVISQRSLEAWDRIGWEPDGHVWGFSASALSSRFRFVRKDAGLADDLTFHALRHYFAVTLIRRGVPIMDVQALLGHRFLSSTQVYLNWSDDRFSKSLDALAQEHHGASDFLRLI